MKDPITFSRSRDWSTLKQVIASEISDLAKLFYLRIFMASQNICHYVEVSEGTAEVGTALKELSQIDGVCVVKFVSSDDPVTDELDNFREGTYAISGPRSLIR